jgi:hypothetical protein
MVGWMSSPRAVSANSASANTPKWSVGLTDPDCSRRVYGVHDSRFVPPKRSSRGSKSS